MPDNSLTVSNSNTLVSLLDKISTKRLEEEKPLAVALIEAIKQPPADDLLKAFGDGEITTDDWRRIIGGMAQPRGGDSSLVAGARTIARQFVTGDKDAVKLVRDTLDGVPVQETKETGKTANQYNLTMNLTQQILNSLTVQQMEQIRREAIEAGRLIEHEDD